MMIDFAAPGIDALDIDAGLAETTAIDRNHRPLLRML
jgi:hypothetical protein